jgi:hypothetical protein
MRTFACRVAVLGAAFWTLASGAYAAPTVIFKAKAVPINGFLHTGNFYGAGAAVETELTIKGSEYGGYPPPLIGVKVYLPTGVKLHPSGFPTCSTQIIERIEPEKCPKRSSAGPPGFADGFVVLGERVPERVSLESFYAPGGGINTIVLGHTPASIEIMSPGTFSNLAGGAGFGPVASFKVPEIISIPGSAAASTEKLVAKLGTAIKKGKTTFYYATMPNKGECHGGLKVKAELTFAENGSELTPETVTRSYDAPCPRASEGEEEPVPETAIPGTGGVVTAPSNHACLSHRDFKIHVLQIKGLTYRQVSVDVDGHRVKTLRGPRVSAPVDLRGLPKGRYTVKITVTTSTGRRIAGTRSYHTCAAKPLPGKHHRL